MKLTTVLLIPTLAFLASTLTAQPNRGGAPPLTSLKSVPVPTPPGLDRYVRDTRALVVLGKAFFWDMQAGSDGKTACATCHFHAGADHRLQNQLAAPATSTATIAPNQTLTPGDFPFRRLSNPNDNRSTVLRDTRQIAGSAGVFHRNFFDIVPSLPGEQGADQPSTARFTLNGVQTRQVTSRNSPSVINAVFNVRNFWDGRAKDVFTGSTPFGDSDTGWNVLAWRDGQIVKEQIRLQNSSLASQAVGPALNETEMSYLGRTWPKLAQKLLALRPLGRQAVAAGDSVLGPYADPSGLGLASSYQSLIEAAFDPAYWQAPGLVETNFAIYWGLSIQAYEATLVSNDSRVDRFLEGNQQALSALEQQGLRDFQNGGSQCTQCHQGAEFTAASFSNAGRRGFNPADPRDLGFFRTAVSPLADDPGLNSLDAFGQPLFAAAQPNNTSGAFKSPGLRNVELTGPYFHDGGQATLEQVMDFYGRQGDFPAGGNLGPGIGRIRLSQQERTSIVAFMKALTDDRVRFQRAPFDHPALCVPTGHAEAAPGILATDTSDAQFVLSAIDRWALIPAVGREGETVPLQTFDELLRGIGNDGSRAHHLTTPCVP